MCWRYCSLALNHRHIPSPGLSEFTGVNSLPPGRCGSNFKSVISSLSIQNDSSGTHEIALGRITIKSPVLECYAQSNQQISFHVWYALYEEYNSGRRLTSVLVESNRFSEGSRFHSPIHTACLDGIVSWYLLEKSHRMWQRKYYQYPTKTD